MPTTREEHHTFTAENGAELKVCTEQHEMHWSHKPPTHSQAFVVCDDASASKIYLWHNGERWIVRHEQQQLGDSPAWDCVDQWELRNETEAREQFNRGLEDVCND